MNLSDMLEGLSVSDVKRAMPFVGAGLILYGLIRRSPLSILLAVAGGGMVYRALEPYWGSDAGWKIPDKGLPTMRSIEFGDGISVEREVTIDRATEDLYSFWRNLENLPRIMSYLDSVHVIDSVHSHWVAKAPAGLRVEWDAEILNEIPNQLIAWRSVKGADVGNAGSVHFEPAPSGHGTVVRVHLRYDPPAGRVGAVVARLFGTNPNQTIEQDLRQFKRSMELGQDSYANPPAGNGWGNSPDNSFDYESTGETND